MYQAPSTKYQVCTNMPSSPDSSSDSSSSSPQHAYDGPNAEAEATLPGVIMSCKHTYAHFFFQLADLGMELNHQALVHNALAILKIMPADRETIKRVKDLCKAAAEATGSDAADSSKFDSLFFVPSPTQVAYTLGVIYSLVMPAQTPFADEAQEFQLNFVKSGCGFKVVELVTRNNFLSDSDDLTKM